MSWNAISLYLIDDWFLTQYENCADAKHKSSSYVTQLDQTCNINRSDM